jgi:predicted Fe-Mo cluster-binding NifX family protein
MKIVLTSQGSSLSSPVDPRFGRCPFFIFFDTETDSLDAVENPHLSAMGGAGIQAAQFVANKGAAAVLTGSCGPNAFQTLQAAGLQVFTGIGGKVEDAIERFKEGDLNVTRSPTVGAHFGMGGGVGRGIGRGMGRGMGRGKGIGMRQRPPLPSAQGMPEVPLVPEMDKDQRIAYLKQQAENLKQQIEAITKQIIELEGNK